MMTSTTAKTTAMTSRMCESELPAGGYSSMSSPDSCGSLRTRSRGQRSGSSTDVLEQQERRRQRRRRSSKTSTCPNTSSSSSSSDPHFKMPILGPLSLILLTTLTLTPHLIPQTSATPTAPSSLPQIDFDRMGLVTLTGNFIGLGFERDEDESSSLNEMDGDVLLSSSTVSGAGLGVVDVWGRTGLGGKISSVCRLGGDYYVGGQFGSIAVSSSSSSEGSGASVDNLGGLARYTPGSDDEGQWYALGTTGGVGDGMVEVVWCDESNEMVWIGGTFEQGSAGAEGPRSNVLVYYPANDTLAVPPFMGLDGSVYTITPSSSGDSLYFGGNFSTSFDLTSNSTHSTNSTTTTLKSILDRYPSSAPEGTISTGYSRYLTPLSLTNASIDAGPSSGEAGEGSVQAITCPEGETGDQVYYGRQGSVVKITVRLFRELRAVGLRLGNTFGGEGSTTGFR